MPSRTPICSARSSLVLRGLPTMTSRMFIGGWFALRLSSCVTICSELARKVNGGGMRDAARFCCNRQKRLYVFVNSPTETDGHDTDRKSTRLNSNHGYNSYSVFFFKKKK